MAYKLLWKEGVKKNQIKNNSWCERKFWRISIIVLVMMEATAFSCSPKLYRNVYCNSEKIQRSHFFIANFKNLPECTISSSTAPWVMQSFKWHFLFSKWNFEYYVATFLSIIDFNLLTFTNLYSDFTASCPKLDQEMFSCLHDIVLLRFHSCNKFTIRRFQFFKFCEHSHRHHDMISFVNVVLECIATKTSRPFHYLYLIAPFWYSLRKLLYLVVFPLCPNLFWELKGKRIFKDLQFWPKASDSC